MSSKIDKVFNDIDKLSQKIPLPQNKIRILDFEPLQFSIASVAKQKHLKNLGKKYFQGELFIGFSLQPSSNRFSSNSPTAWQYAL